MYRYEDIREVHLEISSECNAECPLCARNLHGYPYNDGYQEHSMTLSEAKQIFSVGFIKQLAYLSINGNFGDIVMNPQAIEIVKYFRNTNNNLNISISTNAGARDLKFWQTLAELNIKVYFCLDGLNNTHSKYRRNTLYSTVIKNAQEFINAGGHAVWKMIDFDHNKHEQAQARELAKALGFKEFLLTDHNRNRGPVFNRDGVLVDVFEPCSADDKDLKTIILRKKTPHTIDQYPLPKYRKISCEIIKTKSIYVSSVGRVYPCCFLGFAPETYGHGNGLQVINEQIKSLIENNNALEVGLEQAMHWFTNVENSWQINDFKQGRLIMCNNICGRDND